ncbi:MAG: DUF1015 domain-containing protein [Endomicrobiia bacterium]
MVEIKEFHGLIYNQQKLSKLKVNFKDLICPPFDTISSSLHRSLLLKKYNFVNLELPKGTGQKKYQNAKKILSSWKRSKIIVEDDLPSIYLYSHKFSYPVGCEKQYTRYGIFCLIKADPSYTDIIPHEHTNPKPIEERAKLISALNAQTSSPFFIVEDEKKEFYNLLLKLAKPQYLFITTKDSLGDEHKIYKIVDSKLIGKIKDILKRKKLYIADGHHRYKVTCEYLKKNKKEYLLGYICSLEDEGLLILPTHRALAGSHIVEELKKYFDFLDWDGKSNVEIVFYHKGSFKTLKPKISFKDTAKIINNQPYFLLDRVLRELEGEKITQHIFYHQEIKEVVNFADKYDGCAFILPAVKKEEFSKVLKDKIIFPPKSTYFYPKVFCGFVFYEFK